MSMRENKFYIGVVHKDEGSDYGVSFPDFPGCVTAAATLDEATAMAAEALELHVEGMEEDGGEVPAPSSMEQVQDDKALTYIMVPVGVTTDRKVRVNVTLSQQVLDRIEKHSDNRSAFLEKAAIRSLSDLDLRAAAAGGVTGRRVSKGGRLVSTGKFMGKTARKRPQKGESA